MALYALFVCLLFSVRDAMMSDESMSRKIGKKLFEAESRLELALHYRNPYPKLYNMSKMATPETIVASPGTYMSSPYLVRLSFESTQGQIRPSNLLALLFQDSYFDDGSKDH